MKKYDQEKWIANTVLSMFIWLGIMITLGYFIFN